MFVTKAGLVSVSKENYRTQALTLIPTGIALYKPTHVGPHTEWSMKTLADFQPDHATEIRRLDYDYQVETGRISPDGDVVLPVLRRDLEPTYHRHVDEWLRLLFGRSIDKANAWLSVFPDSSRAVCALFLVGPKEIGKDLLAHGLARIWAHGEAIPFKEVVSDFNGRARYTPMVWANEALPNVRGIEDHIRTITTDASASCVEKFRMPFTVSGYRRLLVTQNSLRLTFTNRSLDVDDLQALEDRIWSFQASGRAGNYLRSLGKETRDAMAQHQIAEHVLHLGEVISIESTGRFAVSGSDDDSLSIKIMLGDPEVILVLLLVKLVMDKARLASNGPGYTQLGVYWGNQKLSINAEGIRGHWDILNTREEAPSSPVRVFKKLNKKRDNRSNVLRKGVVVRAYSIDPALFYAYLTDVMGVDTAPYESMIWDETLGKEDQ